MRVACTSELVLFPLFQQVFFFFFFFFAEEVLSGLKASGSIHLHGWIGSSAVWNVIKRGSASRRALELGPIHFDKLKYKGYVYVQAWVSFILLL